MPKKAGMEAWKKKRRQEYLGKLSENPRLFNCRDESVTKPDHIFPNIWLYFSVFVLYWW